MQPFPRSRFIHEAILRDENGKEYYGRRVLDGVQSHPYLEYYTKEGDRIDDIAERFLGSPFDWWQVADLNPEVLDFSAIPANTRLRVPNANPSAP